jgi:Zn-dependent protease with chaperone function
MCDSYNNLSWAIGINPQDFLSVPVTGVIYVDSTYLRQNNFTDGEITFILAHESVHIFRSHVVSRLAWNILESIVKGPQNKNYNFVEFFKALLALLSPDRLPPNAILLRDNEYEADELAVRFVTRDLNTAISCLKKLSGGNLNSVSHKRWGIRVVHRPIANWDSGTRPVDTYGRTRGMECVSTNAVH